MSSLSSLWWRGLAVACVTLGLAVSFPLRAQEVDPEEAKEQAIIERFVTVLEKNPRRGTALDKIYGYHVERGSLDGVIKTYRGKAAKADKLEAAGAWMVVGLMESLRGQDAMAVKAFEQTETLDPASYLASYYLGQSQVLIGQPDKAAEALERATQRKPAPSDQLDVYQALGRVYQRAQKSDKALEVWNRLEKQFPNDSRVQEQIAATLLEEGEHAAALPRFESLAKLTKDKYRQSLFQMEAAEIKVKLGKGDEAKAEFEKLLGQLNPDNWLFREVRRRIENIFLRTDDQAGLIAYYEAWVKKNPEDLEAISRLSRLLAGLGRGPEAQSWLEKALKSAPTKKDLRHALIAQLLYEQKFVEVIAQYEQLDKHEPNNPDTLRDWGRIILKDTARDEATRKKDAATVWRRLTTSKPKDPLVASQVAELFRSVEMTDEALELYQKAMALAPEAAQYKEYLGEYFHSLKRKDEAMATWRLMADGKSKNAANVARLAEVLSGFGYLTEAVETNAEACQLDPKEINLQIKQVDLLSQAEKHEDALKQLDVVKKLAANDEEREAWLGRELKELQAIGKLKDRIEEVRKELAVVGRALLPVLPGDKTAAKEKGEDRTGKSAHPTADKWFWLARAHEAQRELKEAGLAVTKASELAPQSIPILMSSARILEAQNNILGAVEVNTKLAAVDRRYRTEYLKKVAQLEMALGRREKAIQAGRDLIAAAPGNPELYEFFSQLCFGLGEAEEGLQALRRSVRVNPTEPKGLLLLASALSEQFRTSESIELYWRAFDKAGNLEDRLGVMPKLTELYLQTNQFDRLLERLERQRREPNQQREMTICLAQAYQSAGDDGNARTELEKLLTDDTRDTQLLTQLVKLCESDGDLDVAVRYQQQLNKVTPGKEGTMRLAGLLMKAGEKDEATALMQQLTESEKDPEVVLKTIDSLLTQKQFEQALTLVSKLTRDQPKNWELLYREGAALAGLHKSSGAKEGEATKQDEAAKRFETILTLKLKDEEQSLAAKKAAAKAAKAPRGQTAMNPYAMQQQHSLQYRVQLVYTIRQAVRLDNQEYYGGGQQQQPFWAPTDYGQVRMAAMAWQMAFAQTGGKLEEFFKQRKDSVEKATDRRDLIDWYYLASLKSDGKEQYKILKTLAQRPDADREVKQMYLYSLSQRGPAEGDAAVVAVDPNEAVAGDGSDAETDYNGNRVNLAPLSKEELEQVIAFAKEAESLTELDQHNWGVGTSLELIAGELKRAGRKDEAEKLYADALANAKEPMQIATVLQGTVQRGDYDTALKLLDRLAELIAKQGTQTQAVNPNNFNYMQYVSTPQYQSQILGQLMSKRAQANQRAKKENVLDGVFPLWQRYLKLVAARDAAPAAQTPAAKKARASNPYGNQNYFYIWRINGQQTNEQIDFPQPNDICDHATLQMLRQMFALHRETEQLPALTDAFAAAAKDSQTPAAQRQLWQFCTGYLHWWNDEKDEALATLSDAIRQVPDNTELKFELARLHEKRREFAEALVLIDGLTPSDQAELQKREVMALRLAVNGGDIDRARAAADRLFGLRLDSQLQMALAKQMHQLGMHEQAEAVLARAGRQAGNKTDVLSSLMEQYASTGKNEVAIQIAHQLLRRSKPNSNVQMQRQPNNNGTDPTRTQALQVLNRSGKLPEMIAKVESQLKNSPKSQRLLETLLEYHVAAGNDKKVEELNAKLSESKVDNPAFRYQLAMKLLDAGKTTEANEHLKVVFEKEPRLAMNNYWELQQKYEQHNKLEDLASLYESIDLKVFRQNTHVITNAISNMANRDKTKERSLKLFKKAWQDLPEARNELLSNMRDESFWKLPEIYDYAREGIIPSELTVQSNRFMGFGTSYSYGQDGKITTLYSRILDMSVAQKKLDALSEDVAAAIKKMPTWTGGKALAAMIDLRKGRVEEAKAVFTTMLPTFDKLTGNDVYYAGRAMREIGQELMAHEACVELAIKYFELSLKNNRDQNEFQYTAGKPLMILLKKQGRKADARQVLIDGMNPREDDYGNGPEYAAYRRINTAVSVGKEFQDLGYPTDAIKIYQRTLSNTDDFTQAQRYGGSSQAKQQLQASLKKSLADLKPEALAELLAPVPEPKAKPNPANNGRSSRPQPKVEDVAVDPDAVDLILLLDSRELDKTKMSSALGNLIAGMTAQPAMLDQAKSALTEVRTKRPDDFGAAILATQIALATKDEALKKSSVEELVALVERIPLDAPSDKGTFTAKQRSAAMQQAQLWLIARDCLKQESLRAAGDTLAKRSLEAAKRQTDNAYALAILREWGQLALQAGDKPTAERLWGEMLEMVLPKPGEKKAAEKKVEGQGARNKVRGTSIVGWDQRRFAAPAHHDVGTIQEGGALEAGGPALEASLSHPTFSSRPLSRWEQMLAPALVGQAAVAPAPPAAARAASTATSGNRGGVTLGQFEQAAQIAKLAADNGLTELALTALTKALHGGPPLEAMQEANQNNPFGQPQQVNANSQATIKVQLLLAQLESTLRQKGVNDDAIYALLRGTVFPESRPLEAFLYTQPLASSPGYQPQSIGALFVRAAVKAKKTDDFKTLCESRLKQPLGELAARVLLGQLALATRDTVATQEQLALLSERLKLDSLQNTSELACHVALPAITLPDAPPIAIELVAQAVDRLHKSILTTRGSNQQEPVTSLTFRLAGLHFQQGKSAEGKKLLDSYLALQGPMWANYGGDYPAYQRKLAMLKVAGELARAGLKAESLDMFGRFADATTSRDYQVGGPGQEGAALLNGLAVLKPAERYDLLKAWSLPTKDRLSVRFIAALVGGDKAPAAFDAARGATPRAARQTQFLGTADLLVSAAAATGKLNELQQELEPHAAKNVENAKFLLLLTRLAQPDDTKIAADLLADIEVQKQADAEAAKNTNVNRSRQRPDLSNAILAQAAVAREATREAGLALATFQFTRWSTFQDHLHMTAMRHLYNATVVGETRAAEIDTAPHEVGLAHWTGGAFAPASYITGGAVPSWWLAQDGMIQHVCGPDQSYLFLNYPITGTFEFSCEAWLGGWAEGNAGYGGLVFDALNLGSTARIYPVGYRSDVLSKSDPLEKQNHFNRITIRVSPNKIQHLVNGVLIHDEKTTGAATSPWLLLQADRVWQTVYRDLRITGTPEIPREVKLTNGSSLLGWSSGFYAENQAKHFQTENANDDESNNPQRVPDLDWWAVEGEIHGRRITSSGLAKPPIMQSRLHYTRPLRSGDTLKYEFWYEPGVAETHVHPALDRLAMILDPEGVKLHWMTESNDGLATAGLPNDNLLDDAAGRRGEGPLALKERDWNSVSLSLMGDVVTVTLNNKPVYERTLEPDNDRQFGLYHDKHTAAVRVRNVVLTGDWPKTFTPELGSNLTASSRQPTADERQRLGRTFEDKYAAASVDHVLLQTRALPPAERYAALLNWVLPNDNHTTLRLYGEFTPADVVASAPLKFSTEPTLLARAALPSGGRESPGSSGGPAIGTSKQGASAANEEPGDLRPPLGKTARKTTGKPAARRTRSGGELISPAIELVALAKELDKLPELVAAVEKVPESTPQLKRSRYAMLVLMSLAAEDFNTAGAVLTEMAPGRNPGLSDDLTVTDRWPEMIAAWEAMRVPELRPASLALFELIVDSINRKGTGHEWDVIVRGGRQRVKMLIERQGDLPLASGVSPRGQWTQGTLVRATSRGSGLIPRWRFDGNTVQHVGGHGNDLLFFQSPLRGTFTVEADLSTHGWREARAMYGGIWAAPQYTLEATDIGNLTTNWVGPKYPTKLEPLGDFYRLTLEVTPDKAVYHLQGRAIHETTLGDDCDPWLAIHAFGQYAAEIRSLRITGEPQIPEELHLSKRSDLQGWFGDVYGDTMLVENAMWRKNGDEITGQKVVGLEGRSRESLLQYHRPMLEDGEITYDFFHVAGQTLVHPALGRLALLLDADGVKVHWLTDAQFERTGLAPDNVFVEQEHRRGPAKLPLKANDWNQLSLKLTGDTLALSLNGESIYERPIEASNLRTFGLFHYAGDTDVRVKNVIYRGNWPKTLPSVKEQEFAGHDLELASFKPGELPATFAWNFQGEPPRGIIPTGVPHVAKRVADPNGMRVSRLAGPGPHEAGYQLQNLSIQGDFVLTLGYRDFQSQTKTLKINQDWQSPRVEIMLPLGGDYGQPTHTHSIAFTHRRLANDTLSLGVITGANGSKWVVQPFPQPKNEGRLRIVRRGVLCYFLTAPLGSDAWQLLERRTVTAAIVGNAIIGVRAELEGDESSCVLTEFSIQSAHWLTAPQLPGGASVPSLQWNGAGPQPAWLQKWSGELPNKFEPVAGGIQITRPQDPKQKTSPVGFHWSGSLKGDFEATLSYRDFESTSDKSDWQAPRVELHIPIGGANDSPQNTHTAQVGHRRAADGKEILTGGVGERQPDGNKAWKTDQVPTKRTAGRLRVVRQGSMIHHMAAEAGSDNFMVTGSRPASEAEVKSMSFTLRSESQASSASVVFTEITIRAGKLEGAR